MKPRHSFSVGPILIACSLAVSAHAAEYTWSGSATGTWDTTGTNWAGGPTNPWTAENGPSNTAIFNTASLAATVSNTVVANGVTALLGGTLTGTTGTLTLAGASPLINVASGQVLQLGNTTTNLGFAGTSGFTKAGEGVLAIGGSNKTITGGVQVDAGILRFTTTGGLGSNLITLGASSGTANTTLDWVNNNTTTSGNSVIVAGTGGTKSVLVTSGVTGIISSLTLMGDLNKGSAGTLRVANATSLDGGSRTLNITAGSIELNGAVSETNSGSGIIKLGGGGLTLGGTNTYSGDTTVTLGTLTLNYATNNTSKLSDTGVLTLGGLPDGTTLAGVTLAGSTGNHVEVVASTTLNIGGAVSVARSGNNTATLALNTVTPQSGVLNVGATGLVSVDNTNINGILGRWATFGNDWAVNSTNGADGLVAPLASYTATTTSTATSYENANVDVTTSQALDGALSANSLRFNTAGSSVLTLTGDNSLASGGILVGTASTTATHGVLVGQISGGTLAGANDGVLLVNNRNTATGSSLTIGSSIVDNGTTTLVKHGQGTLILTGNNSYSGGTVIGSRGGYIQVASDHNLGATSTPVTIYTNTGGGLILGDGFRSDRTLNVFSSSELVVLAGTATWAGTIDLQNINGPQIRTVSFGPTATLNLTGQVINAGTTGNPIVHQSGNLVLDTGFSLLASTSGNLLLGRSATQSTLIAKGTSSTSLGALLLNTSTTSASATLTIQDEAQVTGTNLDLNNNGATTSAATVNLNGGRLTVNSVLKNRTGATQTAVVNLNGGELRAGASSATFWSNLAGTTANVLAGGAKIHTNGNEITISQALLSGVAADGGLEKLGTGSLSLTGSNTYLGTTSVAQGSLLINGNQSAATGAVTIAAHATLGGSGTVGGAVTVAAQGRLAPGQGIGTLSVPSADLSAGGILAIDVQDSATPKSDTLAVTSELNLTNAKLHLQVTGPLTEPSYTLATAGNVTGTINPADVTGLPTGYAVEVTATELKLVAANTTTPFSSWMSDNYPSLSGPAALPESDPDGDGLNNLLEFALNGNPTSATANGYYAVSTEDTNGNQLAELTLTVAVRNQSGSPSFVGSPSLSASVDRLTYRIQGSLDLTFPTTAVVSETSAPTGLPALPSGWEYRRFRLNDSEGLPNKGFLRLMVEEAP